MLTDFIRRKLHVHLEKELTDGAANEEQAPNHVSSSPVALSKLGDSEPTLLCAMLVEQLFDELVQLELAVISACGMPSL